jgi:hypothetical protein
MRSQVSAIVATLCLAVAGCVTVKDINLAKRSSATDTTIHLHSRRQCSLEERIDPGGSAEKIPRSFFDRFFPPSLTTVAGRTVPLDRRDVVFAIGSLSKGAAPVAVAVFTNSVRGAVSVISITGQGLVMSTAAPYRMVGFSAQVALVDFDGSGNPNIVVTMDQSRGGPTTWIFRWTGTSLQTISPGTGVGDRFRSSLADTILADIDGLGRLSVIDRHAVISTADDGTASVQESVRIFRYVNGTFEDTGERPDFMEMFTRGKGSPAAQTDTFDIADPATARDVVIINGGGVVPANSDEEGDHEGHNNTEGSQSVSSAEVFLNGQPIASEKDFKDKPTVIRVATHLLAHNQITVKINGSPGSTLTILVVRK